MQMRELLFPPGATRHDWVLDGALAAGLGLMTIPPYGVRGFSDVSTMTQFVAALLMILPLVFRRHSPLLAMAGVTFAGMVQLAVSENPMATLVAIPVVSYSVARWIPGRDSRLMLVIGGVGSVLGPARWTISDLAYVSLREAVSFSLAVFVCMGLVITPYAVGRRVRESSEAHLDRVAAAEDRYRRMLLDREQQNRLAESRARTQIARELHDIVAHSLSVMIVQAEGGRALAAKKPEAAAEALNTIAETGREALSEMRRILGVLRDDPAGNRADFAPAPRLADIPDLVARTSDRASLEVGGFEPSAPAAVQLTAYRVVQEALTNFLKHAGPEANALVTITYGDRAITINVVDNGAGVDAPTPDTPGHGLRGMHERVTAMGGRLLAKARPGGGFEVTAVLPITPPSTAREDYR